MGELIALEGLDGAGKRTLTAKLVVELEAAGARVATLAFPRYGESIHADIAAEALRGQHGDLAASVHGMAMLFALDRAAAKSHLSRLCSDNDVVILDRYVASNAAYGAARLRENSDGPFVQWIENLEFGRFRLPLPARQMFLGVPVELAQRRAAGREGTEPGRERDIFERDGDLQRRTANVYSALAAAAWVSPWRVLTATDPGAELAQWILG
ncbi:dTMP kinase [Hoyosella subflava]|uniref:Thymidylate kinase n=1 Tax=Hoyosella subflava (strain DSM 45089 / JCM 17490 / NBRC 109087 / DQS3-9A1) TaxID=443218 RepID=F6EFW7_HOYSD|nr:dTMP kinase [Hoyosella subflava]AEF42231.1 Thymidylate kinase [Hoyosella subflava DQS3-9A1]